MRWNSVAVLLLAFPASLSAQHMGSDHFTGHSNVSGIRFGHAASPRAYYRLGMFDPFYADYLPSTGYPAPPAQVIVLPSPLSAAAPEPARTPSQPLMIELQGDRYVQISGDQSGQSQMIDSPPRPKLSRPSSSAGIPPTKSVPAVLVFRDGRRQEVTAYTIADGTLYAGSDYATTGIWNQKIELSSLNLPETIAANHSRGQSFPLPSSPNEVIVGP